MKKLKEFIPYVIIVLVVVLIRSFIVTPARVSGDSMDDTLIDKEIVIVNKIYLSLSEIKRFDIVVVEHNKELLIKRVIGLPNEKIEYKDNKLYINDNENSKMTFEETEDFVYTIGTDEYFVMGDNRDISKDSRYFGSVNIDQIKGEVGFSLLPFNRFGKVN
jgi:signal peptidase I